MPSTDSPIVAARRKRLAAWIAEKHKGRQKAFLALTGLNQGMVSALVKGPKPFGEKMAASIEEKAGMPAGHLVNALEAKTAEAPAHSSPKVDAAIAGLEKDSAATVLVFGAMFTVMLKHRPAEAADFLRRLEALPAEFQDADLVKALRKAARALRAKA